MKRLLHIWLILAVVFGCEDPIEVSVPVGEPKLVVEGVVSDLPGPQRIKLSTSNDFNSPQRTPRISDAVVQVADDNGGLITYLESSEPGVYFSDSAFQGQVGMAYKVQIQLSGGGTYESDFQELQATPVIDALTFTQLEDQDAVNFIVTLETTDNNLTRDFYRWRVFKNEILQGTLADVFLRSDRLFNGNPFQVQFESFLFENGDVCRIEQFSLSEAAFDFFRLVQIQAGEIGESTSTAPAQVIGNVRNLNDPEEVVLGFFYATSIVEDTLIIRE